MFFFSKKKCLLGRDTSPCHPTMRLHRQLSPENWAHSASSAARDIRMMASA
jgi:hypothetical protein